MKILGTPVGCSEFVKKETNARIEKERQLWEAIPAVDDLQAAWQIVLQSAGPRCNYFLRTLPPSASAEYAAAHDAGMWSTMNNLLKQIPGTERALGMASAIATLPMRLGGLGLRSAQRTAPAAFWASWADALPMLAARCPRLVTNLLEDFADANVTNPIIRELREAELLLKREGFLSMPSWDQLRQGVRPDQIIRQSVEPGEWSHGWQYFASSSRERHFRRCGVLAASTPAECAHLRSRSGPGASAALSVCPTSPEFQIDPPLFRGLLLDRLRFPLQVSERM